MRKLVLLMLVLGIASVATAGLSFSAASADTTIGGTVTVDLISSGGSTDNYVGYYALAGDAAAITGTAVVKGTLTAAAPVGGAYAGWYAVTGATTDALDPIVDGDVIMTFTLTGLAAGSYDIVILLPDFTTTDTTGISTFTVNVPEPITMGLLGLGGLFLRRRK